MMFLHHLGGIVNCISCATMFFGDRAESLKDQSLAANPEILAYIIL